MFDIFKNFRNTVGVKVIIDDVNDNPPLFIREGMEVRVYENAHSFSDPLVMTAVDADLKGSQISHFLMRN